MKQRSKLANACRSAQRPAMAFVALLAMPLAAGVIDRVVAVVGPRAITASEVEQQARLEAMLNRAPLAIDAQVRRDALQRLIDLRLIQAEATLAGFLRVNDEEVRRRVNESKSERYDGGLRFEQALEAYDLGEQDVADFWRQYIGFEGFKDFRFKTGLDVSADEVTAYYERHIVPRFRDDARGVPPPLNEIYEQVEQAAIEERANEMLDQWLKEMRSQTRIVMLEEEDPAGSTNAVEIRKSAGR